MTDATTNLHLEYFHGTPAILISILIATSRAAIYTATTAIISLTLRATPSPPPLGAAIFNNHRNDDHGQRGRHLNLHRRHAPTYFRIHGPIPPP